MRGALGKRRAPVPNESSSETNRSLLPRLGTLRHVLIAFGLAAIGLILLYLLRSFAGALLLIFAGVLLGILLRGLTILAVKWLRLPRALALALLVLLLLGIVVAFFWLAGPQVFQQGQVLVKQLPQSLSVLQNSLQKTDWGRAILMADARRGAMTAATRVSLTQCPSPLLRLLAPWPA